MLMTRDEALSSVCPMTLIGRNPDMCITDKCAAWRWVPVTNPDNGAPRGIVAEHPLATKEEDAGERGFHIPDGWRFVPWDGDNPAGWEEPKEDADRRRRGYCGLAGKPEL